MQSNAKQQIASFSPPWGRALSFDEVAKAHGFAAFIVLDIDRKVDGRVFPTVQATSLDQSILDDIDRAGGLVESHLFNCLASSTIPIGWQFSSEDVSENDGSTTTVDDRFRKLSNALNLRFGYGIPVHSRTSRRGLVAYFTSQMDVNARFPDLVLDTIECFTQANFESNSIKPQTDTLSQTEKKCLLWAAQGKTNQEISTLISLSEHSVNHFFASAAEKLGANNRTHVVAKAIHKNLIDVHDL